VADDIGKQLENISKVVNAYSVLKDAEKAQEFDWSLFKKPIPRIGLKWLVISLSAFALVILIMILFEPLSIKLFKVLLILGFAFCAWSTFTVHCRFEQTMATTLVSFFGLMILLIASGLVSPMEAADTIKHYFSKD